MAVRYRPISRYWRKHNAFKQGEKAAREYRLMMAPGHYTSASKGLFIAGYIQEKKNANNGAK